MTRISVPPRSIHTVANTAPNGPSKRAIGLALASLLATAATGAEAQQASQITPRSFAPAPRATAGGIVIPEQIGPEAPAGAEKLFVRLAGVDVVGAPAGFEAETEAMRKRLSGRVSGAALFGAARDLEATYARAGYLLVRVTLPPQTVRDGARLKLVVVDGSIERVDTSALPARVRERVAAVVAPLVGRGGLTEAEIERRLLLAGETPGLLLRSTLKPGARPGTAVLVLDGVHQPVSFTATFDNTLSNPLGRVAVGLGADFNGLAGYGEQVYLRTTFLPDFGSDGLFGASPINRQFAGGLILPIGTDGLTLNVEATQSKTAPKSATALRFRDTFERLSTRLRYPWVRGRTFNLATEVALDVTSEVESIAASGTAARFAEDRLRVLRLTGSGDYRTSEGGFLSFRATASFGIDGLGARGPIAVAASGVPLSRDGASPDFQKLDGQVSFLQSLFGDRLGLFLTARGQTGFGRALAASEQIGLGGPGSLSAYSTGSLQGDSGGLVRGEVSTTLWTATLQKTAVELSPYAFGAAGVATLARPTALEVGTVRAAAFGAGLRLAGAEAGTLSGGVVTLEYAHGTRTGDPRDTDRFTLSAALRY